MSIKQYSVLILNDSPEDFRLYHSYLSQDFLYAYNILEVRSQKKAFVLLSKQNIDIILIDDQHPYVNALEFLKQLNAEQIKIPVVILLDNDETIAMEAMNLGAEDYLIKSKLTEDILCRTVRSVLKQTLLKRKIEALQDQILDAQVEEQTEKLQEQQTQLLNRSELDTTDCKQAEMRLEQAEAKYRKLIEQIPGVVYTSPLTKTNKYAYISPQIKALLGLSQEEWCGGFFNSWADYVHPEDSERVFKQLKSDIEHGRNFQAEYRMIARDGRIVWVTDVATLVLAEDNHTQILQGVAMDISNRKHTESILEFQTQIFEQIHDAVISTDINGIIETWNQGAEELYGYNLVEAIGQSISFLYFPEDLDKMQSLVFQPLLIKGNHETVLRNRTKSGEEIYISLRLSVMRDEGGKIIRFIGCSNDISEQKRGEESLNRLNQELEQRVKERTAALEHSESRLLEAQQIARLGSWECDRQKGEVTWSPEMFRIFRLAPNFGVPTYEQIIQYFPPKDRERYTQALNLAVNFGQSYALDLQIIRADGSSGYIFLKGEPIYNAQKEVIRLFGIVMDITERKEAEIALRESEQRYATLAAAAPVAIYRVDTSGNCIYVNDYWSQMTGRLPQEALGDKWLETIHPEDLARILREFNQNMKLGDLSIAEGRIQKPDGSIVWFFSRMLPEADASGTFIGYVGTLTDITALKNAQELIIHNSLHDPLTGLPNRTLLLDRLELAINRAMAEETYLYAVLFIDLDRFKVINDSLGHLAGDQLLINITQKLKTHLSKFDLLARFGGDEFVILHEDISSIQEVIGITEGILRDCQKPLMLNEQEIFISISIGIVFGTKDYKKAADLLRDADIAMYRAKAQGRSAYTIFDTQMHIQAVNRLNLEGYLRKALAREELLIYYQPIFDLLTYRLIGFEALVRWQHPTRGLMSPGEFVPLAEETGIIVQIDRWMFHQACQQLAIWKTKFASRFPLKVSINLCVQDLRHPDLIEYVDHTLADTGLEGEFITLEITESMLMDNIHQTIDLLTKLKSRKIQISIDDFGTGYSSLNYLHLFPSDNLKIDRSFVTHMHRGNPNYQVINTILTLSNQLGLAVIAEGIESQKQLELLQELGCEMGQGYLFSEPLAAEEIEKNFLEGNYN